MAKQTLQEQYVKALVLRGGQEVPSRSRKYIEVHLGDKKFFVGRSGALRTGPNSTSSIPVSDAFKKSLLGNI